MAIESVPQTREQRGIVLAMTRGEEIERTGPTSYLVPSRRTDEDELYIVHLDRGGFCTCPDWQYRRSSLRRQGHNFKPLPCAHIYATEVVVAKRRMARSSAGVA